MDGPDGDYDLPVSNWIINDPANFVENFEKFLPLSPSVFTGKAFLLVVNVVYERPLCYISFLLVVKQSF